MRLLLLAFALVAAAAAVPPLEKEAADVDLLKKQLDVLSLLRQLPQDLLDDDLYELGSRYNIIENIHKYYEENTVKLLYGLVKLGRIQRKGYPFTTCHTELRKEVALLTRTFLSAKDYETFLKTAAWARFIFNEDQFYKAFLAACLQRDDTKGIIFPAPYEVFPHYYFDTRLIRKAQDLRIKGLVDTHVGKLITIPNNYTAWLPMGEDRVKYFSQDIGLASWYFYFSLGGWMTPKTDITTEEGTVGQNYVCTHCETGRGASYYYMHQQLLARYDLERLSTGLRSTEMADVALTRTPFKPHLSYLNGLEFPGRDFDYNTMVNKKYLFKLFDNLERRLEDAIDSGYVLSTQGSLLSLYDKKGLDMFGTLMEGTGRSINPRYYGSLQAVARELLGGSPFVKNFWEPLPSALDIQHTTTRDPVFYKLWKRFILLFKRLQDSLPSYKQKDLIFPGVVIESLKFDELKSYCDEFLADIDAATILPKGEGLRDTFKIKTLVERLNHKPYNYEIIVNSDKIVKNAVIRIFIGPRYNTDGKYCNIYDYRLGFFELDQFVLDLKIGKNLIVRSSLDAPMRSIDTLTVKDIYRKVEEGLNSHEPFYPYKLAQIFGFPERLALPRGRREGLPLQVFAIITPFKPLEKSYGPVVPPKYQTYYDVEFPEFEGEFRKETFGDFRKTSFDARDRLEDISGEDTYGETRHEHRHSGEDRSEDRRFYTHRGTEYDRYHNRLRRTADENLGEDKMSLIREKNIELLKNYYKNRHISELVGGAISLDGKPFGYPLERRLSVGCLDIPNVKLIDVKVFWEGKPECGGFIEY